jgi:hypothetical protein
VAVRPPEISYEPYFYYSGFEASLPLIIPPHRVKTIGQGRTVARYVYTGYPAVILDNLEAHTYRVARLAQSLPLDEATEISQIMQVHDLGELDRNNDLTIVDQQLDAQAALRFRADEELTARRFLTEEDFRLWQAYQTGKPWLEGRADPLTVPLIPNAIIAKLVDVIENETYFHTWFGYLKEKYGQEVFGMFPEHALKISFPRLRRYQENFGRLDLPEPHREVGAVLLNEIEKAALASDQVKD